MVAVWSYRLFLIDIGLNGGRVRDEDVMYRNEIEKCTSTDRMELWTHGILRLEIDFRIFATQEIKCVSFSDSARRGSWKKCTPLNACQSSISYAMRPFKRMRRELHRRRRSISSSLLHIRYLIQLEKWENRNYARNQHWMLCFSAITQQISKHAQWDTSVK